MRVELHKQSTSRPTSSTLGKLNFLRILYRTLAGTTSSNIRRGTAQKIQIRTEHSQRNRHMGSFQTSRLEALRVLVVRSLLAPEIPLVILRIYSTVLHPIFMPLPNDTVPPLVLASFGCSLMGTMLY